MKGGGSYYQALQYVDPNAGKGAFKLGGGGCGCEGRRANNMTRGGFFPSLMGGVISNGPLLLTPAIAQAARLMRNESERMAARHRRSNRRTTRRRQTRRTKRNAKNTRKA